MSAELQTTCALNISDEALSSLRDGILAPDESARIRVHAETCAVCRQRLDGFEWVGAALRGQRLGGPSARLWDDVHAVISAGGRAASRRRFTWKAPASVSRPRWTGLGALAAALVVALLFGAVLHSAFLGRGGMSSAQPTATSSPAQSGPPIVGAPPNWQEYSLPDGMQFGVNGVGIAISSSNGDIAYVCGAISGAGSADGGAQFARVEVTHDRGAHWTALSEVAVGSGCGPMHVDLLNPNDLIVGGVQNTFRSVDGGLTWTSVTMPSDLETISRFATFGGRIYMLASGYDAQIAGIRFHLAVSADNMRSWRNIDGGVANGVVDTFWMNASSGDLLADTQASFWQSHDGGAHWSVIPIRDYEPSMYVAQAQGASAWRICNMTVCTENGGATWTPLPTLSLTSGQGTAWAYAETPNGTLLAVATSNSWSPPRDSIFASGELYELPANGARWIDRGLIATPEGSLFYGPSPEGGALWQFVDGPSIAVSQYYSALLPTSN